MDLDKSKLPSHVAVIMDGNGRWAKKRLLNRIRGHEKGMQVVRTIVRTCRRLDIPFLTLYAFSTENWQRSRAEVAALMLILKRFLKSELKEMQDNNIRLDAIGQIDRLPPDVIEQLAETKELTKNNNGMLLNLALSYGGRAEIVRMVKDIAADAKSGNIDLDSITPELVSQHLYTKDIPDPDLMIRTSGEMRISNFLLWQIAYSELYVTDTLWPDFGKDEFIRILKDYQKRERRFGAVNP
jgi:undecaprenyl diphosphate synthase